MPTSASTAKQRWVCTPGLHPWLCDQHITAQHLEPQHGSLGALR